MSWTTPKIWSGSEVLTASDMNTYVGSNIDFLYDNCPETTGFTNYGTVFAAQLNQRIESGAGTTQFTTINYGSTSVTFNVAFGTAPRVVLTPAGAALMGGAANIGTAGFTAYCQVASGTYTGTIPFNWIAIGA